MTAAYILQLVPPYKLGGKRQTAYESRIGPTAFNSKLGRERGCTYQDRHDFISVKLPSCVQGGVFLVNGILQHPRGMQAAKVIALVHQAVNLRISQSVLNRCRRNVRAWASVY